MTTCAATSLQYYNQSELWDADYNTLPEESERLELCRSLIPPDVCSVLDVGCGNGSFLNPLGDRFRVAGLDVSEEALRHVRAERVVGVASDIPFPDGSFDLVTCLEVLEHLSWDEYGKTLREVARVASKYAMISVPNQQNLDDSLVICTQCRCHFNAAYHVRSYSPASMRGLLAGFHPLFIREVGPLEPYRPYPIVLGTAHRVLRRQPPLPRAICPQCGYRENNSATDAARENHHTHRDFGSPATRAILAPIRMLARCIWRPIYRRRWLLALYGSQPQDLPRA